MKELQELTKLIEEEIKNGAFPGANYAIVTPQRTYLGTVGNKSLIPSTKRIQLIQYMIWHRYLKFLLLQRVFLN